MNGGHFLFVESNTTGTGALAVGRLLAAGARVTFLARQPEKYPFLRRPPDPLSVVEMETNDLEAVAERVARVDRVDRVDAVLTFSEFYVEAVAEVARRQQLRYLSPAAAHACRSKPATREALRAAGLATPEFRLVRSAEEAWRAGSEVGFPCVVKPPADSSSKGVRLVANRDELLEQFRLIHGWQANDRGQPLGGEVLVESALAGPEVSVETVTLGPGRTHVVGITAKHLSPPPSFVELGHDFPAALEPAAAARVEAEAQAALAAVGFDFGPAHTEVRLTPAGPVVVEINPRLAGGMIPELVRHAAGIDLLGVVLAQLRGLPVDLVPTLAEVAAIRFLTAGRSGRLAGAAGLAQARRLPGVREIVITKPVGAAVRPAEDAYDRVGFVIASGPAREQVLHAVERARRAVRLDIDQAPRRAVGS